jgi:hypothetical protein
VSSDAFTPSGGVTETREGDIAVNSLLFPGVSLKVGCELIEDKSRGESNKQIKIDPDSYMNKTVENWEAEQGGLENVKNGGVGGAFTYSSTLLRTGPLACPPTAP